MAVPGQRDRQGHEREGRGGQATRRSRDEAESRCGKGGSRRKGEPEDDVPGPLHWGDASPMAECRGRGSWPRLWRSV